MRVSAKTAAIFLIILFPAGILTAKFTGVWLTESSKIPATYTSGEFAGEYNPSDIRGSYSFADVEKAFGVPIEIIAEAFGFSGAENPAVLQVKEFEALYKPTDQWEIGTDSLRLFTALYIGRPHTPEETTALPGPAARILKEKGELSEEELAMVKARTVSLEDFISGEAAAEMPEDHDEGDERLVKGKTTFAEILSWGVSKGEVESALGMDMGPRGTAIRDYCTENEIEFADVKTGLQALVDSK